MKQISRNANQKDFKSFLSFLCEQPITYVKSLLDIVGEEGKDGLPMLHQASKISHIPFIKFLVDNNDKINKKDNSGGNLLHTAAENDNVEVFQFLIEYQTSKFIELVNEKNYIGRTPFHLAVKNDSKKVAELLIKHTATHVNAVDNEGKTAFHLAAENGILVEFLSKNTRIDVYVVDNKGKTAFHLAAENAQKDVINFFIHHKTFNVNQQDQYKQDTALNLAIYSSIKFQSIYNKSYKDYIETIKILLQDKDIDPNIKNKGLLTKNRFFINKKCERRLNHIFRF